MIQNCTYFGACFEVCPTPLPLLEKGSLDPVQLLSKRKFEKVFILHILMTSSKCLWCPSFVSYICRWGKKVATWEWTIEAARYRLFCIYSCVFSVQCPPSLLRGVYIVCAPCTFCSFIFTALIYDCYSGLVSVCELLFYMDSFMSNCWFLFSVLCFLAIKWAQTRTNMKKSKEEGWWTTPSNCNIIILTKLWVWSVMFDSSSCLVHVAGWS